MRTDVDISSSAQPALGTRQSDGRPGSDVVGNGLPRKERPGDEGSGEGLCAPRQARRDPAGRNATWGRGRILAVKQGYNPNSSSVGSQIPAFLALALGSGALSIMALHVLAVADRRLRRGDAFKQMSPTEISPGKSLPGESSPGVPRDDNGS